MTAPYSPGYNPYSSNELDELERQRQMLAGMSQPSPVPSPDMGGIVAPPPIAAPSPETIAPAVQPLDISAPVTAPRRGMATSSVTTQGMPDAWTQQLENVHKQLTAGKMSQIEATRKTEEVINQRGLGQANARGIESANEEVAKRRALEESAAKQAELRKAQDEWSQKKEDGSASKALGGNDLALTLTAIGIAAGTFSQAMGWQNGNPVREMLDKSIDRSIAAQREQKNSRLNVLAARLGDEKAAEAQVRSELHDATATRIAAQMQGTQHQDALDRLGPLAQDQQLKAQQAQAEAAERLAPKQSVTQTPVKTAGGVDPLERAKKGAEAAMAMEKAGVPKEEIVAFLRSNGYQAPTGKSAAELERSDAEAKKKEKTPAERKALADRVDGLAESVQAARELDEHVGYERGDNGEVTKFDDKKLSGAIPSPLTQIAQGASNMLPWGMNKGAEETVSKLRDEDVKKLERIRDQIVFGQAKADGQGALSGPDREVYRAYIPTDSPLSLSKSTAEQWRKRQQAYINLSAEDKELVDARLRERGVDPAKEFAAR